jgi:hypothetical protein
MKLSARLFSLFYLFMECRDFPRSDTVKSLTRTQRIYFRLVTSAPLHQSLPPYAPPIILPDCN